MDWYEQGYSDYTANRSYMHFSENHKEWAEDYASGWKDAERKHHQFLRNIGKLRY